VTKRKPLTWHDIGHDIGIGIDGHIPNCDPCWDLLCTPGFIAAVYSVAIEHPGDPADLARQTIDTYHARRHPAAEWGSR
jgi:hypothetical protein